MSSTINSTGTSSGLATTADASGVLELQGGGNTGITIDASGNVSLDGSVTTATSLDVGTTLTVGGVPVVPPIQLGCAVAISSSGYSFTEPVVSEQAYMIRDIFQTPSDTTISLRLQNIPAVAPTELVVRVDAGWDGASLGQHPAESAVTTILGVPTHVPWTCAPGANLFTIELLGTTWVADSHFVEGHCYVPDTLIEASVPVDALMQWCRAAGGPTTVHLPPGMMYVREKAIKIPEGCTVIGGGMRVTGFFWADYAFQTVPRPTHVLESGSLPYPGTGGSWFGNVIGTTLADFCVYGNRSRQLFNSGTHALAFGYTDAEATFIPVSMTLRRIGVFGSAGYGIAMQGSTIKRDWIFEQIRNVGSDNDGYDFKDRVDGNANFRFIHCETIDWGLGNLGTNLRPLVRFPADPITITIPGGDPSTLLFTIPRRTSGGVYTGLDNMGPSATITLSGVTAINGVDFNGSFHCVAISDDGYDYILEHTVPLTMNTAGAGGSTVDVFAPYMQGGAPAFDCRARNTRLDHCYAEGWLLGRTGIRQRSSGLPAGNAIGGSAMIMNCCSIRDTTPAWTRGIAIGGVGFSIGEGDIALINPTVWGMGNFTGIQIGYDAQGVQITQPRVHDMMMGVAISGTDVVWTGGMIEDCSLAAVYISTNTLRVNRLLEDDPLQPVAIGNSVVRVTDVDHGLWTGAIVGFYSVVNSTTNGLIVETPVGEEGGYPIVVEDDDHYLIDLERTDPTAALNTDVFGGTLVTARMPNDGSESADNIHISDVLTSNTDPNNTSIAYSINTYLAPGYVSVNTLGTGVVNDVSIVDCHDRGSSVSSINYGTNIQWGPGNSGGIPNIPRTTANVDAPCWEFVEEKTLTVQAVSVDFIGLDYPEIRIEIPTGKPNAASLTLLQLSTDSCRTFRTYSEDVIRLGVSYGNAGLTISANAANTTFASAVELEHFNSPKRTFGKVEGGQTYDALGVQGPGSGGPNSVGFFLSRTRALLYVDFGGNPDIPGLNQLTNLTIGGVPVIGSPVSYVTIAVTAATWDTTTKVATFTLASPHTFGATDVLYIQGMTPDSYDGFLYAGAGTIGSTIVGTYFVTPYPEPSASATGMGIVAHPEGTAAAITAEINAYMATLPAAEQLYTALTKTVAGSAVGVVIIRESEALTEALYGVTADLPVVPTTTGDFVFDIRTSTAMSSNRFNSFRITGQDGILKAGTTIRVYQKGG